MKDVCNLEWFGRVLVESHTVCLEMQDQTAETTSVDIFLLYLVDCRNGSSINGVS